MLRPSSILLAPLAAFLAASRAYADADIADIRVAPLLKTEWSQRSDKPESSGGEPCYNLFTPENAPCGCVATAVAQVMRYHCFPSEPVEPATYACYFLRGREKIASGQYRPLVERVDLTMQGGVYDWADMPPVPAEGTTPTQRQAIGKLTSDVGIACRTVYGEESSSAQCHLAATALAERFAYGNADAVSGDALSADFVRAVLVANLDAGLPVLVGLKGSGGHAVVADGYGYSEGTFLAHFNLGRSGCGDGWYEPLEVAEFKGVQSLVFNISPSGDRPTAVIEGETELTAFVGVRFDVPILRTAAALGGSSVKVSVRGLPRGLKFRDGRITGVPTAPGRTTAALTVRDGSESSSLSVTFDVEPLAAWARGTFNGAVIGRDGKPRGILSLTASAAGKLNGKFDEGGTNWTVKATSFAGYDAAKAVYAAEAVATCTAVDKTPSGRTVRTTLKRSFRLEIGEAVAKPVDATSTRRWGFATGSGMNANGVGELISTASEKDVTLCAWQNAWSGAYKEIGKEIFRTGKKAGRTYEVPEGTSGLAEGESLTLAVTPSGKVTAKGVFPREVVTTDSRGRTIIRRIVHRPTCTTVVIPTSSASAGAEGFRGMVYVSFPPSEKNGFAGYAAAIQ